MTTLQDGRSAAAAAAALRLVPVGPGRSSLAASDAEGGAQERLPLALPYPLHNMLTRWRGMVGMVVGVGIALAIGMTLLGAARASIDNFTIDFRSSAANLYVVAEGGTLVPALPSDSPGTIKNARHVLAAIRQVAQVEAALGMISAPLTRDQPGPRRADEPERLLVAMGVDGDPAAIPGTLVLNEGRWLRRSDEVVIGQRLSREEGLHVGDSVGLAGRDFTVVGVGKLRGLGAGFSPEGIVYMEGGSFRQRAELGDLVSIVVVQASDPAAAAPRIAELGSLGVLAPEDLVRQAEAVNAPNIALNWILILLTLSIAALFVSNMLGRSVVERRIEFATMRAIGLPRRIVLLTVGCEALAVSLAAGSVGTVLSLGLGGLLNRFAAPAYGLEFIYVADPQLYGVVFALAIFLGLVSGLFPARRAMGVDPVDVLREA
ncbi:MAG TPA: ABC transporter permease [Chloroflexota bacterium]|nr:ABC transporter permease [Chloroflexota bacterium]